MLPPVVTGWLLLLAFGPQGPAGRWREDVLRVIERLRDEVRLPILYVSHDRAELERLAGTIIEM